MYPFICLSFCSSVLPEDLSSPVIISPHLEENPSALLCSASLLVANYSVQFSSVAQSCQILCDPMNRSTPGLPVHHQLPVPSSHLILCRPLLLLPPIPPKLLAFTYLKSLCLAFLFEICSFWRQNSERIFFQSFKCFILVSTIFNEKSVIFESLFPCI